MRAQHLESRQLLFCFFLSVSPRKTYFVGYLPPGESTVGLFVCFADASDPEKLGARKREKSLTNEYSRRENLMRAEMRGEMRGDMRGDMRGQEQT